MPTYLSPGVYVEEISSGSAPITGLSTSTAGFIGVVSDAIQIPISPLMQVSEEFPGNGEQTEFNLNNFPVNIEAKVKVLIVDTQTRNSSGVEIEPTFQAGNASKKAKITIEPAPTADQIVKVKYIVESVKVTNEVLVTIQKDINLSETPNWEIYLDKYPVNDDNTVPTWKLKANGTDLDSSNVQILNDDVYKVTRMTIPVTLITDDSTLYESNRTKTLITITADYQQRFPTFTPVAANEVKLCTNFNEFKNTLVISQGMKDRSN
ncbi:hypothetical protein [Okeania sp. KiyG1]|uniref:hypothetical protein n=1 Tax=Okeania sp. KiyG1 TaxID=2720165 RepID=UPI0019C419F9|nr:hypothetical protein [Okeania sp. KiyG1]GGA02033.1 hypothetical protein CYANOKiyG1_13960 [Okeania sp. KiyG1]